MGSCDKGIDVEKLQAWMKLNNINRSRLAGLLGVSHAAVRRVLSGAGYFHPSRSRKIIDESNGQIDWADLYPFIRYVPPGKRGKAA